MQRPFIYHVYSKLLCFGARSACTVALLQHNRHNITHLERSLIESTLKVTMTTSSTCSACGNILAAKKPNLSCVPLDKDNTQDLVNSIDDILFDCDGVLWRGHDLVPGSLDTVQKLKKMGKRIFYITNNSTKTREEYCEKITQLGFPATKEDIVCTAYVAALYLHNINFKGKIYLVGNPSMAKELDEFGFNYFGVGPDTVPEDSGLSSNWAAAELDPEVNCVLVGFDSHLSYWKMVKASTYARQEGCLFLATNTDTHLPHNGKIVVPGTGSIVAAVQVPSRREPLILGKPNATMFDVLHEAFNLDPERTLMVGDRCDTDIALAGRCGLKSLLVLSGVSALTDVDDYRKSDDPVVQKQIPTFYAETLGVLGKFINEANHI